jgi:ketosteroid isomerase-like protein
VSQENVDFVRQASRAWNDGGLDALLEYLDAEVEWLPPQESMESGIYRGHDGVRDYLGRPGEIFQDARLEPLEVIDVDDRRVIAVVRLTARSGHSEAEIIADWAWLVTVGANRKGRRVQTFTSKAQALKAVGLAE